MIPETGEDTLQAARHGDPEAFRRLMRQYAPRMERLIAAHVLPHEIPEVAQEAFVRAYRSLPGYQGKGSLEHWLSTIVLRCCCERLRERYRPESSFSSLLDENEEGRLTDGFSFRLFEEEKERRNLLDALDAALETLEPRDRMLLTLTFLEGYSVSEAAAMMGMSEINARVRVHRSKAKLRRKLKPSDRERRP